MPISKTAETNFKVLTGDRIKLCEDLSDFILFIIFIGMTIALTLTLSNILPVDSTEATQEAPVKGAQGWIILYLIIGVCMLYAWGIKPVIKFYKAPEFKGSRLQIIGNLTRAVAMPAALFAIAFVTISYIIEVVETIVLTYIVSAITITLLIGLFCIWKALHYVSYASVRRIFDLPVIKPAPWRKFINRKS